ncbi:MAG: polysaccharide biosynthesis protein, partial [Gammaproteobacteria bacterium]|nr:polysaccharide biosynthesis protein [Gammaproteobacteria bacterium]NIO61047.1 polysaccharide biosynthesis protein [Gammaproteobacteria bacterium]NIT39998.1 polysaccharide biosynthesis protein [Gammaproteobacteria bacterium]
KVKDIPEIAAGRQADIIIIAVPSASNEEMQKILVSCEQTECTLRTLPPINDMVSGKVRITDLRDVSIEDLLGREKVELDWKIIQQG